jgi:hypothetical protein
MAKKNGGVYVIASTNDRRSDAEIRRVANAELKAGKRLRKATSAALEVPTVGEVLQHVTDVIPRDR